MSREVPRCIFPPFCALGDSIFLEDIEFRTMAKGCLGKHTLDASFGQFRTILKYVCHSNFHLHGTQKF